MDKRTTTLFNRLKRELAKLQALPPVDKTRYRREIDYKRTCTLRTSKIRVLCKQIKTLEEGRHFSTWHETVLDNLDTNKVAR